MNLVATIERWARERPSAAALIFGDHTVSFGRLNESVNRLASGLSGLGIREGDRVAIMLANTPEFVYTFYACQKLGAVAVPFNTMYKAKEIRDILGDSGARAIVCQTNFVSLINEVRPELPALEYVITTGERTTTFADPQSTMFVQAVLSKELYASLDDAYRRIGGWVVEGLTALGVRAPRYCHVGAVRVDTRKIAGFVISETRDLYVVNGLCFVDRFDPTEFFSAIWVPPEVKDKIAEPVTSVAEETGRAPTPEEFKTAMAAALAGARGAELVEAPLTWLERLARGMRRRQVLRRRRRV